MATGKENLKIAMTPWFPGSEKPVRRGVYQRVYHKDFKDIRYCFWDGDWRIGYMDVESAYEHRRGFAHYQNLPWRGINNEFNPLVSGN